MIEQSGIANEAKALRKLVVLDNACGTGVLTRHLYESDLLNKDAKSKLEVTCSDTATVM